MSISLWRIPKSTDRVRSEAGLDGADCRFDLFWTQRHVPKTNARGIGKSICQRRSGRTLSGFRRTQERKPGSIDNMNFDRVRNVEEAENRVRTPVEAGPMLSVIGDDLKT
jgi:hypothetical protein